MKKRPETFPNEFKMNHLETNLATKDPKDEQMYMSEKEKDSVNIHLILHLLYQLIKARKGNEHI